MENVNILSVVIATLIPMIVGFVYYNPRLAGNAWMNSLGITVEDIKTKGKPAVTYSIALVMSFLL